MSEFIKKPIGILAIQGDFAAHTAVLHSLGVASTLVKNAAQLEQVAGLILPGGESTTLLKFLDGENLWEPLKRFAERRPMFGTCAGAILLASEVENPAQKSLEVVDIAVRRNAFGRQVFSFIRHASLTKQFTERVGQHAPKVDKVEAVFIRAPLILRTGKDVETLATLDDSPVLVQQGNHLVATFHPELSAPEASGGLIHRYFCSLCYSAWPAASTVSL